MYTTTWEVRTDKRNFKETGWRKHQMKAGTKTVQAHKPHRLHINKV